MDKDGLRIFRQGRKARQHGREHAVFRTGIAYAVRTAGTSRRVYLVAPKAGHHHNRHMQGRIGPAQQFQRAACPASRRERQQGLECAHAAGKARGKDQRPRLHGAPRL